MLNFTSTVRTLATSAMAVACLVAPGCGDGSTPGTTTPSPTPPSSGSPPAAVAEVRIPGGEFEMGDHHGFVDPSHPSDELPIHVVRVSTFYMASAPTTNRGQSGVATALTACRAIRAAATLISWTRSARPNSASTTN